MTARERALCYWMTILPKPIDAASFAGYTLEDAAEAAAFLKTEEAREQIELEREKQEEAFADLEVDRQRVQAMLDEIGPVEIAKEDEVKEEGGDYG